MEEVSSLQILQHQKFEKYHIKSIAKEEEMNLGTLSNSYLWIRLLISRIYYDKLNEVFTVHFNNHL